MIGFASSVILGIFISPELNFRFHIWMELITNHSNERKQKLLKAKLTAELDAIEVTKQRAERFAKFQAQQQQQWKENTPCPIDNRLAELLFAMVST